MVAMKVDLVIKRLGFLMSLALASNLAVAVQLGVEEEVASTAKELSTATPVSNGKGSYILGSRANGKVFEIQLRVEPELKDWKGFWRNNVCTDRKSRRILAMGGLVEIQEYGNDNQPRERLVVNSQTCAALGATIQPSDAIHPAKDPLAPVPMAPAHSPSR